MDSKVSVIVPVNNDQENISSCIESVLKQNYSNIELLLVDGGSTDHSGNICDEYAIKDWPGESQAADEFLNNHKEAILKTFDWTNTPGAYLIKN